MPYKEAIAKKYTFESAYDGKIEVFQKRGDKIWIPRGALTGVQAKEDNYSDYRDYGTWIDFDTTSFKSQKPEQDSVIAQSVNLLHNDRQFIISAATGYGKTWIGAQIAGLMKRRFCVITTKEDIIDQWIDAIKKTLKLEDHEIGIWRGDQVPLLKHKAVVALVQSVCKGPERYGVAAYQNFGMVMCDEVHRMGANEFSQAMWHFPAAYRVGLSATPERRDGKDQVFFWHIGPVLVTATQQVMIPKVMVHKTSWKIPRNNSGKVLPHSFGNTTLLLKPMCRNPQRNQLIVNYLRSAFEKGRSTIAFSDSVEHLTIVYNLLLSAGIPPEKMGFYIGVPSVVYGGPKATQLLKRKQHSTRSIVLSTYKMASEATNLPWLDTCVMMTPRAEIEQIVGRIRREYADKKPPLVVDLWDTDGEVLMAYGKKRQRWYNSLGCVVRHYQ